MKSQRMAAILFVAILAVSATASSVSGSKYLHLEGAVDGGESTIVIDVNVDGTKAEGSYYFVDSGAWRNVKGTFASGRLTLVEKDFDDKEVARISARRGSDGKFTGTWRKAGSGSAARTRAFIAHESYARSAHFTIVELKDKLYRNPNRRTGEMYADAAYLLLDARSSGSANSLGALKRSVSAFYAGASAADAAGNLDEFARMLRDKYFDEYREMIGETDGDLPSHIFRWFESNRVFARVNEADVVVLEFTHDRYRGGAHGQYTSEFGIFDLATGKRVTRDDLLLTSAIAKLRPILKRKVLDMISARIDGAASDADLFIDGEFPVSENVFLRRDGMGFHYDCEEIACHALSSFDVVMTWAELEGMLRSGTIAERLRTNPDETVIAGRLAETVHQHPIVGPDPQFYFDWERPEGGTQQIIVVNAAGVEAPTQAGRRIELRGVMKRFSLGGRPGTRDEYSNSVLYLKSWSYIR